MDSPKSRVGMYYVEGPADREYIPGAPGFTFMPSSRTPPTSRGCVTVENKSSGETFSVAICLFDEIAARP